MVRSSAVQSVTLDEDHSPWTEVEIRSTTRQQVMMLVVLKMKSKTSPTFAQVEMVDESEVGLTGSRGVNFKSVFVSLILSSHLSGGCLWRSTGPDLRAPSSRLILLKPKITTIVKGNVCHL